MSGFARKSAFVAVMLIGVWLTLEAFLALAALISPGVAELLDPDKALVTEDPRLGHRGNPRFAEHDDRGFRNVEAISQAKLVILGDSLTYGAMVGPESAWPRVLEQEFSGSVYNMGFGGWGPTHGWLLREEAAVLKPSLVLYAVYAGNDLFDAYDSTLRLTELAPFRTDDVDVIASLKAADDKATIGESATRDRPGLKAILKSSGLYGLMRAGRNAVRGTIWSYGEPTWTQARAAANRPGNEIFDDGTFQTVLTLARRGIALNFDDPRIREGERITKLSIEGMNGFFQERNIEFGVLLIPTKELVFSQRPGEASQEHADLANKELQMWRRLKEHMEQEGISHLDLLPALLRSFERQGQPFRRDEDGHFSVVGNAAVAARVGSWAGELIRE